MSFNMQICACYAEERRLKVAKSMASNASKIPRYVKSTSPVLSRRHGEVLSDVKKRQAIINTKLKNTLGLKSTLSEVGAEIETVTKAHGSNASLSEKNQEQSQQARKKRGPQQRTIIETPGGTKRKVNTAHQAFKAKIADTIKENVIFVDGKELGTDEIISLLEKEIPECKGLSATTLLKMISDTLGCKVLRKGKSRFSYYSGVMLKERILTDSSKQSHKEQQPTTSGSLDLVSCSPHKSPRSKIAKGEDNVPPKPASPVKCRTRLIFQDTDEAPSGRDDMSRMMGSLDLSTPDLKEQFEAIRQHLAFAQQQVKFLDGTCKNLKEEKQSLDDHLTLLGEKIAIYTTTAESIISTQDDIIESYKDIVQSGSLLGGLLSINERDTLADEVKKVKDILHLGLRDKGIVDIADKFDTMLFSNIVQQVQSQCPTITSVLEQLVLSKNVSRNTMKTADMKMKASIHLLASLMDVRDKKAGNDVPVLFGLVCMCYGAGPSMIQLMQHLGLSTSFQVLTGVLKKQLDHYKEIIKLRVPDGQPVITYQDNMQIKRTSMRHLRLSKLQKEKMKQNKMWDFTVRGWRVADTEGIEEHFQNKNDATACQKKLDELEYKDTLIASHKEHMQKWCAYKKRNLLQKMDTALNRVNLSKEELKSVSDEALRQLTSDESTKLTYDIVVPPPVTEFPRLANKPSKIFPLPISHENQVKIVGVAGNLELFTDEFKFQTEQEKKYLPLKRSGKDFDLDRAYERYAFLKSLERHKEAQQKYEQILRQKQVDDDNQLENLEESDTDEISDSD